MHNIFIVKPNCSAYFTFYNFLFYFFFQFSFIVAFGKREVIRGTAMPSYSVEVAAARPNVHIQKDIVDKQKKKNWMLE